MRVGILTEGQSEYAALPVLYEQLKALGGQHFTTLRMSIQPDGPAAKIAREVKAKLRVLEVKNVERVVVLIDREQRQESSGEIRDAISNAIQTTCGTAWDIRVVIKNRTFENWVIADVDALAAQPARFKVTPALRRSISPDRADSIPALDALKSAVYGRYEKVQDAKNTLSRADAGRTAANSRSFRHFLHEIGDPRYLHQCRVPGAH